MQNGDHPPERLWAYDDYTEFDDQPADTDAGPASLGFFRAALRRRKWVWRGAALAGFASARPVLALGLAAATAVAAALSVHHDPFGQ